MYGYTNSEDVAPGKQGGKFGLNSGCLITKFEYNSKGGKEGAEADAIDFTVKIGEREFRHRFFPVNKVYAKKGGGEITDTNSEEYKTRYKEEVGLLSATLIDIVTCVVPEDVVKQALATSVSSFAQYAQIFERLVKSNPNWDKVLVDVWLQYQWSPVGTNEVTFLELPSNVKHGSFIVPTLGPGFVEDRTTGSLKYVNPVDGREHNFKRSEWYANSDFAKQTGISTTANSITGTTSTQGWS